MTNSFFRSDCSSLAWVKLSGGALLVVLAGEALALLLGAGWPGLLIGHALALGAIFGATVSLARLERALSGVADVCRGAAKGDLERRILGIPETGLVGALQTSVNQLLDITDAFVREARGSMQAVGEGRYYRKVLPRGMPGSFRGAAETMNRAIAAMEEKIDDFVRFARTNVREVASGVAAAAVEMNASAATMTRTASDLGERTVVVAAATEETAANVTTVAAAA